MTRRDVSIASVVLVGLVIGCAANRHDQPAPTTQPARQRTASANLLSALTDTRRRAAGEVDQIERELDRFKREHRDYAVEVLVLPNRVKQLAEAVVAAEMALIDARLKYAEGHPTVRAAERNLDELMKLYEQARKDYIAMSELQAQHARLLADVQVKREFVQRLDDRIRQLEVAIDADHTPPPG